MLTINRHISFLSACFSLVAALMLGSCVNEDLPCPPDPVNDDSKGVTIEFSMATRNAKSGVGSRELIDIPTENQVTGYAAENYLDLDNLLFLLFDDQQTLLRVFKPNVTLSDDAADQNAGPYVKYKVRAFLNDPYFLEATAQNITFTIVVVGNYDLLSPLRFAYHAGQKLEDIFDQAVVGTFAMPGTVPGRGNTWIPQMLPANGHPAAHIPMAGMQTWTVSVDDLKNSTVARPFQLTSGTSKDRPHLHMLRALAKIEIIDRIGLFTNADGSFEQLPPAQRTSVKEAELVGFTTRGSILPTFAQWTTNGIETQYVSQPSVPAGATYVGYTANSELTINESNPTIINFFEDTEATNLRADKCPVFSCYLTEYDPAARGNNIPNMWIKLTTQSPVADGSFSSSPFRLEVAPYNNNAPGAVMEILRNNIYRYEITGLTTGLDLKLIVDDWTSETTEWNYTDNPGLAQDGYLQWSSDDLVLDDETATLTYQAPLTGRFAFDQPRGALWTASFVPVGNDTEDDAFVFIDGEGNEVTAVSGVITGAQSEIKVKAKYPAQSAANRVMRLIFTVKTEYPDERTLTADVLGGEYGDNTYFTIIQNAAQ